MIEQVINRRDTQPATVLHSASVEEKRKTNEKSNEARSRLSACQCMRKGGWAIAQSPILTTTITLERLKKRGYQSMLDYYFKVNPTLNEPLITRPV